MKFRKKPVVIEAIQWDGTDETAEKILNWSGGKVIRIKGVLDTLAVPTLEGLMVTNIQDWVIKGIKGEFYPCKPDIFEATYELSEK